MLYRTFNDEKISLLGFGGLRFPTAGGKINVAQSEAMIDYAITHGVNYFDTAYAYWNGASESLLGGALSKYPRETYKIATKIAAHSIKKTGDVETVVGKSLEHLKTNYIDNYLLHNIKSATWPIFKKYGVYDALTGLKKRGVIHSLGFSFHDTPELLREVIKAYEWDFAYIQLNYMDWTLQNAKEQYEILKEKGIPIIVMEPVRGGALSVLCESAVDIFKAANPKASAASWAIRWSASFPEVVCVLSGMAKMEHVVDNISTVEKFLPISEAEQKTIDEALSAYLATGTIPCTGCLYCSDCPKKIDIASIFANYNNYMRKKEYSASENNRSPATDFLIRYRIISSDRAAGNCVKCGKCSALCPQHINIPEKLDEISNLVVKLRGRGGGTKPVKASSPVFKGINADQIRIDPGIFKIRYRAEYLEFFRHGKHCLGPPRKNENRWVYFPLLQLFKKGKKYRLEYRIKSSVAMNRVFFLSNGIQTQRLNAKITADEWINETVEFNADIDNVKYICITASDLPIVGSSFFVKELKIVTVKSKAEIMENNDIESAEYANKIMVGAKVFSRRFEMLDYMVKIAPHDGLYLEFGVYTGKSINRMAANRPDIAIYGFDSFKGLPEAWRPGFKAGRFSLDGLPAVNQNVQLVVGLFDETLPGFLIQHKEPCAFIHVDCDLYSSTKTILGLMNQRIVPGTIIVFDEYFNYLGWKDHEHKAFIEFVTQNDVQYEYMGYVEKNQQVAVKIISRKG